MSDLNSENYESIDWILNYSDDGFFFLIAEENAQREVAACYDNANVAIYDYKRTQESYSFAGVDNFISSYPQAKAYFLLNFQLAVQTDADIQKLNFSRDMLSRLNKNIIFCVTQRVDDILAKSAYDFYSYIKFRLFFEKEVFESGDKRDFTTLRGFDLSTGIDTFEIDFTLPAPQLLAQAISLTNQAERLSKEYHYRDALSLLCKVLEIREAVLGKEHPDTASTYKKMGGAYAAIGSYREALEWYEKTLDVFENTLGKEHPNTAATYNDIAGVYYNQGDYPQALTWYEKALTINEKVLGKEHMYTATTYNNIALVYYNQGNYPKALEWNEKALAIRETVLGKEHPETATTYNNIAGVYKNQGDYLKAMEWNEKALAISEKMLGKEHPETATTYNNIGGIYNNQGDYLQALEWCGKSYAILMRVLGEKHPNTITVKENMEIAYRDAGLPEPFEQWLRNNFDVSSS